MDYYEILGVTKDFTSIELKTAYRELSMRYHPDKNPGDKESEEHFKKISEAYATLNDPEKRKMYDLLGHDSKVTDSEINTSLISLFDSIFSSHMGIEHQIDIVGVMRQHLSAKTDELNSMIDNLNKSIDRYKNSLKRLGVITGENIIAAGIAVKIASMNAQREMFNKNLLILSIMKDRLSNYTWQFTKPKNKSGGFGTSTNSPNFGQSTFTIYRGF